MNGTTVFNRLVRRNFAVLVLDVAFYSIGFGCFDANTILPQFLQKMGAPPNLIGLIVGLRLLLIYASQPYAAHLLHGKSRVKPFVITASIVSRVPLFLLSLLIWWYGEHRVLVLSAFTLLIMLYAAGGGFVNIGWTELVGRVMPKDIRGRFFGTLQTAASLAALAAPLIVTYVLTHRSLQFPQNYALLLLLTALGMSLSLAMFLLVREPNAAFCNESNRNFVKHLRDILHLWREDCALRMVLIMQFLVAGAGLATSFYVLYARQRFDLSESYVAIYLTAQTVGSVVTGPFWALTADRVGALRAVRLVAWLSLLPPLTALIMPVAWGFMFVFGCVGMLNWWVGNAFINIILSIAPPDHRPTYIGLQQLMNLPAATAPLIGGLIVSWLGYPTAFTVAAVTVSLGIWMAYRIPAHQSSRAS